MRSALRARFVLAALVVACAGTLHAQEEEPLVAGGEGVPVPKKTRHVQPVYPPEALAQGIRGIVILDIVVDGRGKVAATSVLRSVPGLDEAAIGAARQWEYEPTKVDGKPVSVRLTVPITFSLALPRLQRQSGVPELRQGANPVFPSDGSSGSASAEVTLEPDGRVGVATLLSGEPPWSTALLAALRTWRFSPPPEEAILTFRVEADFVRGRGSEASILLRATGLQRTELLPERPEAEPVVTPALPAGEPAPPATPAATATAPADAAESETAAPQEPATAAPSPPAPSDSPQAAPPAAQQPAPGQAAPATAPATATSAPAAPQQPMPAPAADQPDPQAGATPPAPAQPSPAASGAPSASPGSEAAAPPPVEVITAPPPAPPPENGISAIRDVRLEPGVPDLARGRRPVAPPVARMSGITGTVEVMFSVGAGGATTLQSAVGPEPLRYAAEHTVESWQFRRTRADRAYLLAVFSYQQDSATVIVRPQDQPPAASAPAAMPAAGPAPVTQPASDQPAAQEPPPDAQEPAA